MLLEALDAEELRADRGIGRPGRDDGRSVDRASNERLQVFLSTRRVRGTRISTAEELTRISTSYSDLPPTQAASLATMLRMTVVSALPSASGFTGFRRLSARFRSEASINGRRLHAPSSRNGRRHRGCGPTTLSGSLAGPRA